MQDHDEVGMTGEPHATTAVMLSSVVAAFLMSHLLVVFYARKFQWNDVTFYAYATKYNDYYYYYYSNKDNDVNVNNVYKFLLCFVSLLFCFCGGDFNTVEVGSLLTVVAAIPQLRRGKGLQQQQIRVILGPLAPILTVNGVILSYFGSSSRDDASDKAQVAAAARPWTVAMAGISFLAFVVLRPDNTEVLDWMHRIRLIPSFVYYNVLAVKGQRIRLHGLLAACNTIIAFSAFVYLSFCESEQQVLFYANPPLTTYYGNQTSPY